MIEHLNGNFQLVKFSAYCNPYIPNIIDWPISEIRCLINSIKKKEGLLG